MAKNVIVVGAGIIGASLAWNLARSGAQVTVLDSREAGGLATRHSFAWINASWGNPEFYVDFRLRAMREWRQLAAALPGVGVTFCGGLIWDLPPDELEAYATEHTGWGYGIRRVDAAEALGVEPGLKSPPDFALHVAEEGMVEPAIAAQVLLRDAGVPVRTTKVGALIERGGRVAGVSTEAGPIEADEVVVAAGTETAALLETAGLSLKLEAPAGLIAHSTPTDARLLNGLVLSPELHVRQTAQGRLIVGSDFAGADPKGRDREMADDLLDKALGMVRGTERLELDFFTLGHRPTPADGFPIIGRPRGTEGVYAAVMHSGVTLAPLAGLLGAQEINTGRRDPILAPYDPDRPAIA